MRRATFWLPAIFCLIAGCKQTPTVAAEQAAAANTVMVVGFISKSVVSIDETSLLPGQRLALPALANNIAIMPSGETLVSVVGRSDAPRCDLFALENNRFVEKLSFPAKYCPGNIQVLATPKGAYLAYDSGIFTTSTSFGAGLLDLNTKAFETFDTPGLVRGFGVLDGIPVAYAGGPPRRGFKTGIYLFKTGKPVEALAELDPQYGFRKAVFANGIMIGVRAMNNFMFESDPTNHTVSFFDIKTGQLLSSEKTIRSPYDAVVGGGKLYVSHFNESKPSEPGHTVTVFDLATRKIIKTIEVGAGPDSLCYSERTKRVYTANLADKTVTVIDAKVDAVVSTVHLGDVDPFRIACPPA